MLYMLKPFCFGLTSLLSVISSVVIYCYTNNDVFILGPVDLSFILDKYHETSGCPYFEFCAIWLPSKTPP